MTTAIPLQASRADLDRARTMKAAVAAAHEAWLTDGVNRRAVVARLAADLYAGHAHGDADGCLRMAVAILHRIGGAR